MIYQSIGNNEVIPLTPDEEAAALPEIAAGRLLVRRRDGVDVLLSAEEQAAVMAERAELSAQATRERVKADANTTRDAKIFGGVEFKGHVFDTDARSVMNLTGTLAAVTGGALELPQPFYWRSRGNVNVEMTLADLKGLAATMVAAGYQAYLESWAAKDSAGQESRTD